MTAEQLQELRDGLERYEWLGPPDPSRVYEHRYDTEGSDSSLSENERKASTPLGSALFELLTLKFSWESKQKQKEKET